MLVLSFAIVVTAVAAVIDLRRGEIPNWLTGITFAVGIVASAGLALRAHGLDLRGVALAVAGAIGGSLACAVLPFLLWRGGVMGGGDVKLFVALGALCHAAVGLDIELTAFVAGSLVAPVQLALQGKLVVTLRRTVVLAWNLALPERFRRTMPPSSEMTWYRFGPAILLATLWVTWSRAGHP